MKIKVDNLITYLGRQQVIYIQVKCLIITLHYINMSQKDCLFTNQKEMNWKTKYSQNILNHHLITGSAKDIFIGLKKIKLRLILPNWNYKWKDGEETKELMIRLMRWIKIWNE